MTKVKFGARIPTSSPASSVRRLIESTLEAEALGYDTVFATDHIHNSFERHKHYPVGMGSYKDPTNTLDPNQFETVSAFSFLAGMTRKIEFGVGVMPLPLRDPVVLAKEIATLDALSGGRFIFGVGVANVSDREEFKALGKPFLSYEERYEMLGEYVAAMKTIWLKPRASFHGKYISFDDLVIYPKPVRKPHIPIWAGCYTLAGGRNRPSVKFALEHADGWIYGFLMSPTDLRTMIEEFTETAKGAGRSISGFDWCFQLRMSIGKTEEDAKKNCKWLTMDQTSMARYAGYMWKLKEKAPRSNIETASIGAPPQILKRVEELVDAGANHFDLWFMYPRYEALLQQMRLFSKEVLPSFS